MRMDAYLDQVTEGLIRDVRKLQIDALDRALALIHARSSIHEQAALVNAFEQRMAAYGQSKGYIDQRIGKSDDERAETVTKFLFDVLFQFNKKNAEDKTIDAFKKHFKEFIKQGLNSRGKRGLTFLETVWKICNAKNAEDLTKIVVAAGEKKFGEWLTHNWRMLGTAGFKIVGLPSKKAQALIKLIAARISWGKELFARLRWAEPWLVAIDIALTPEDTATDEQEDRLAFLVQYGRIVADKNQLYVKVVRSCAGREWQLQTPIGNALGLATKGLH